MGAENGASSTRTLEEKSRGCGRLVSVLVLNGCIGLDFWTFSVHHWTELEE